MKKCEKCGEKAVFTKPTYCKKHFIKHIEKKVEKTIKRFNLVKEKEKIAVAVSGGKDSQTTLYLLNKFHPQKVEGVAIDEGIPGYRDKTLEDLQKFCTEHNITYKKYSFKKEFGKKLEKFLDEGAPACRSCGVLRRKLLNKYAQKYDKIATGHNLDDECQNLMMNLLKGNLFLSAKLGPTSGIKKREAFTQRIKPLYLCTEKEIATYAFLKGFDTEFKECPHASDGFRWEIREQLNQLENKKPGTKRKLIENFLKILPQLEQKYSDKPSPNKCKECGSPCSGEKCRACQVLQNYANAS